LLSLAGYGLVGGNARALPSGHAVPHS
jgi:hypothetical protein